LTAFSQNEDFAGLEMYYGWITSVHHNKHYTVKFLVTRETRPTKNKLRGIIKNDLEKMGLRMGGGSVSSSQQTRMASECGPMCPPGCGMNRGQVIQINKNKRSSRCNASLKIKAQYVTQKKNRTKGPK